MPDVPGMAVNPRPPNLAPAVTSFDRLLEVLPAGAYTCDLAGRITSFNARAAELWGREPRLNDPVDLYCGAHKLFSTEGEFIPHAACWMALAIQDNVGYNGREIVVERPDGTRRTALAHANPLPGPGGAPGGAVNILVDITERKHAEQEVRRLNGELEARVRARTAELDATVRELRGALDEIKTLRGLIPICAWCKMIRDEAGAWLPLESYLRAHTRAEFSHGICAACLGEHFGALDAEPGDTHV